MSSNQMTTTGMIRVEDCTFKRARKQSEIDKELGVEKEEEKEVEVPVSLTPEQVKAFYLKKIQATQDQPTRRVYAQTIRWIDELQRVKAELNQHMLKELRELAARDDSPEDLQD